MKKICMILMVGMVTTPLLAQQLAFINFLSPNVATPEFLWTSTTYDFGKIKVNNPVTHEFRFTNSGDVPLVISSVQASCGCTVTDYSKDPIPPGAEGYVKATYNAAKVGAFSKTVTVNANAEDSIVQLMIKGEVVEQP
jgi:formylmethanofuran dehydrogenase subunit C